MKKVPRVPLRVRNGEWYRRDGRPTRLVIGLGGSYLECPMSKRREPVDALRLATLFACGRLVRHNPAPRARRTRRSSGTGNGGGRP